MNLQTKILFATGFPFPEEDRVSTTTVWIGIDLLFYMVVIVPLIVSV